MNTLDHIFEAKSVAVIGASTNPEKLGHKILKNIIDAGYKGKVYPINPKADKILGIKAYPSILEVPEDSIDLAVFVVPGKLVPDILKDCAKKNVKGAVIISGGFGEVGNTELENALKEAIKETGIRVIGPNCQGINNPHIGLNASWPVIKNAGPISIASQSGTFFAAIQMWAEEDHIGVSKCAAMGNKIDVDFDDLIEYYGHDQKTKVIAIYMEGVRNGRNFVKVSQKVSRRKPILVLKGGRTEIGAKAVASHTRSLAGKDEIFTAAFKQAGIIRVATLEELYDTAKAFSLSPLPKDNKLLIITSSGGSGIISADEAELNGLVLPELPDSLKDKLRDALPDYVILRNPLDLTGNAYDELYKKTLSLTINEDSFSSFLVIFGDPIEGAADVIKEVSSKTDKPILSVYLGGGDLQESEVEKFREYHLPVYPTPERAVKALSNLVKYSNYLKSK
ncbi:MAG: acetate--CoA ligase family protein [Candidatus Asgardarchaeia archaeon]